MGVAVSRWTMLYRPIKLVGDSMRWAERGGSWRLRWPTDQIVEHVLQALPEPDARKIREQLAQPFFQSWFNNGRINPIYYYNLDPSTLLEGDKFIEASFRTKMKVDGKELRANFTIHDGRFFSVELPKPFSFFNGKALDLEDVTRGRSSDSYTRAIDRQGHGRNAEHAVGAETPDHGK